MRVSDTKELKMRFCIVITALRIVKTIHSLSS